MKIDSRRIFDILNIKSEKVIFDFKCCFAGNCDFLLKCDIFASNVLILSFRNFCEIVLFCVCWNFDYLEK